MAWQGRGPKVSKNKGGIKPGTPASADGFKVPKLPKPPKRRKGGMGSNKGDVKCGGKKHSGGTCQRRAGWGTNHPGIGKCKNHGGSTPSGVKAAASAEYRLLLGKPIEINPLDAIMWCIRIRAGEVQWLGDQMAALDDKSWVEDTMVGKQFHLFARERQHAMADLVRYSQIAISLGIAERAVKMAETYGELLARYTQGIIDELWPYLDEKGRREWPQIVRRRLIALDEGVQAPVQTATSVALPMAANA